MNLENVDDDLQAGPLPLTSDLLNLTPLSSPTTDKVAYKKDKVCTICGSPFSLLGSNQKYTCGFCYRGVCNKCSMQQIYEPVKREILKICDNCYTQFIQTQITSKVQFEIMDVQAQIRFIQEKVDEEIKALNKERDLCKELKSKILIEEGKINHNLRSDQKRKEKVEDAIEKLDDVIMKLESKVVELQLHLKGKEMKIAQYKEEIEDLKLQTATERVNREDLKEKIDACRADNKTVEEQIKKAEEDKIQEANIVVSSNEVELTLKIDRLKAEIRELEKTNIKAERKIAELRNEGGVKIATVSQLSNSILISSTGINPEAFCAQFDNPYKMAKEQFKFNQQEIEELKYELEELRDTDKEVFNADEYSLPPLQSQSKRCTIQ
ncbi:unnamed protein product [Blepharisma stoltei]|uniref:FYVE-type domain-containing protein n=1 Tax=Blepharisma stoltei TaxID=1481888 RepID=A0AAU9ICP7_9CILI|nr:unnamed protein product [Blepharisma stoltei]